MDAELQQLQGTWRAGKIETGGRPVPTQAARRLSYVFASDRVTLVEGQEATGAGTVSVDPDANPKTIDVVMTSGPGCARSARGIYEVTGDHLTLCIGEERPAGFSGAGTAALVELERVGP